MKVKELIAKLQNCKEDAEIQIIQEEELECMPELWNNEDHKVGGTSGAIELYSEDLHSHEMFLLAVLKTK